MGFSKSNLGAKCPEIQVKGGRLGAVRKVGIIAVPTDLDIATEEILDRFSPHRRPALFTPR